MFLHLFAQQRRSAPSRQPAAWLIRSLIDGVIVSRSDMRTTTTPPLLMMIATNRPATVLMIWFFFLLLFFEGVRRNRPSTECLCVRVYWRPFVIRYVRLHLNDDNGLRRNCSPLPCGRSFKECPTLIVSVPFSSSASSSRLNRFFCSYPLSIGFQPSAKCVTVPFRVAVLMNRFSTKLAWPRRWIKDSGCFFASALLGLIERLILAGQKWSPLRSQWWP